MKVNERVVPCSVLVARRRALGAILRVEGRMGAGSTAIASGVVSHVFHISAPGQMLGLELIRNSLHRRRIDASQSNGLAVETKDRQTDKVQVNLTVGHRHRIGALTAYHRNVIVKTDVSSAVILGQERACSDQGSV